MIAQLRRRRTRSQTSSSVPITMGQRYLCLCLVFSFVIIEVTSQILWINPDTGKVLGVSQSISDQPQYPQQRQPQQGNFGSPNYGGHSFQPYPHGNPHRGRPNVQQNQLPEFNDPNVELVCRNRKGDMVIIASEVDNKASGQMQQPVQQPYPNQQTYPDNSYDHNPWLDKHPPQQSHQNNLHVPTGPSNNQQSNNQPTTLEPSTQTPQRASQTEKSPFPTLDNIDWTKYLEKTTKKPDVPNLSGAISGEGVIQPRGGIGIY